MLFLGPTAASEMSLDTLFQQILLTEQELTEQTQKLKEVKFAIYRCNEKIKSATEKYEKTNEELDKEARRSSVMRLQHRLMKKCEDQMSKQMEELLRQRTRLQERLGEIQREERGEEERFLQEISRFNSDFSLRGNRDTVFESQTHTELLDLDRDVESLYKEMELMRRGSGQTSSVQEVKRAMQRELWGLANARRDLDLQLSAAEAVTQSLRAESQFVSQKPHSDDTCLRLREELEMHRTEELELLREALKEEIQLLRAELGGGQRSERH